MLVSLYFILLLNDTYTRHVDLILLLPLVPTGPVFYFGSVASVEPLFPDLVGQPRIPAESFWGISPTSPAAARGAASFPAAAAARGAASFPAAAPAAGGGAGSRLWPLHCAVTGQRCCG